MTKTNLHTELLALCDYGLISKEGKMSAIGMFDELLNAEPPIVLGRGFLVATVTGAPSTNYRLSIRAEYGSKKENLLPNIEANIQTSPNGKANLVVELQGVNFPQPGNYQFKLYANGEEIGAKELRVIRINKNPENKIPN